MFLFDTDIITNIFKKNPSQKLSNKLSGIPREKQFISTITIGEIVYGARKSKNAEYHFNNLNNILLPTVNILSFDSKSAFVYGNLRAQLELQGKGLPNLDLQIASIAIANDLILVTGNIKHFKRIDKLKIENWLE